MWPILNPPVNSHAYFTLKARSESPSIVPDFGSSHALPQEARADGSMTGRPDGCPLSVLQVLGRGIKEIPPQKKNFDLGGSNFWTDSPSELALMSFTPSIRHSFAWGVNTPWIPGGGTQRS